MGEFKFRQLRSRGDIAHICLHDGQHASHPLMRESKEQSTKGCKQNGATRTQNGLWDSNR